MKYLMFLLITLMLSAQEVHAVEIEPDAVVRSFPRWVLEVREAKEPGFSQKLATDIATIIAGHGWPCDSISDLRTFHFSGISDSTTVVCNDWRYTYTIEERDTEMIVVRQQ